MIQVFCTPTGHVAEVWDRISGKTLYRTRAYRSHETATLAARCWLAIEARRRRKAQRQAVQP